MPGTVAGMFESARPSSADEHRVKVLWLVKGVGLGGMEQLLVTHARLGDRDRFDYRVAYVVDRPHSVLGEFDRLGVPAVRLGLGSSRDQKWIKDFRDLVCDEGIDIVHGHSPAPAALARPVVRASCPRTRFVYTEHNRWDRFETITRLANRLTYGLNDRSFAVSEDCRSSMSPRAREATATLVHGVDIVEVDAHANRAGARSELGIRDDQVVVGIVANLRKQKNYPLLMEAAKCLLDENPNLVFLAVGQGPLEAELVALHERLDLGDRFRFLGFRRDSHRVMSAFDVFCLSSVHEGLPVALMEARALGLPVVSTAVGGIPSAVDDGVDGLLVPSGDGPALAAALESLTSDSTRRAELAGSSRRSAARLDATEAIRVQEQVYVSLANRRSAPSGAIQPIAGRVRP